MLSLTSLDVGRAALKMAVTDSRTEEQALRQTLLDQQQIQAVAIDFGGEFIPSVKKIIERAVVAAQRDELAATYRRGGFGYLEAKRGGELLKEKNVLPDIVFTSLLRRAINTANIALDAADRLWIPVQRDWRLNERHYGALQGKNKTEIREEYGDEKFMLWRRSYATPPPEIDPNDQYAQNNDPRYAGDPVPEAECLANVVERVKPYFESAIEPELKAGKTVLIAAHGNSLRAIVKMLDNLSEEEIAKVNIPTAIPLLYELDENFKPIKPRGEYLDPEAAAAGAAAVAAQGQK